MEENAEQNKPAQVDGNDDVPVDDPFVQPQDVPMSQGKCYYS